MRSVIKKVLRFIGPHPYSPKLMFLTFFSVYLSRYAAAVLAADEGRDRWIAGAAVVVISLIPAATFAGAAILLNKFRMWSKNSLGLYLLEVFGVVVVANFGFSLITRNSYLNSFIDLKGSHPPLTINWFLVTFIFGVIALAIISSAESEIRNRLAKADGLVADLEAQGQVLTLEESKLKSQVSQFLHDKVQSNLMVISMRLQKAADKDASSQTSTINEAIQALENLRTIELRQAIESLSPNLEDADLSESLANLVSNSFSDLALELDLPHEIEMLSSDQKMALYKVAEQAILNSQIHGKSTRVWVRAIQSPSDQWVLTISDDGLGSKAPGNKPGLGTAVIDSWLRVLGGSKVIRNSEVGYELEVSFRA